MEKETTPFMSVAEVAKYTHLAQGTVRDLVYEKVVPYTKLGGKILFRRSDIDAWIECSTVLAEISAPKVAPRPKPRGRAPRKAKPATTSEVQPTAQ